MDWSLRGRIRLLPISEKGELPPLTPWTPARLGAVAKPRKAESSSISSVGRWQEWKAAKEQKIQGRWIEEQRNRRRHWRGQTHEFKLKLDQLMEDADGHQSMWVEIQAKKGCKRWCWTHRQLKGAIEFDKPSGEVFLRGTKEATIGARRIGCGPRLP